MHGGNAARIGADINPASQPIDGKTKKALWFTVSCRLKKFVAIVHRHNSVWAHFVLLYFSTKNYRHQPLVSDTCALLTYMRSEATCPGNSTFSLWRHLQTATRWVFLSGKYLLRSWEMAGAAGQGFLMAWANNRIGGKQAIGGKR